MISKTSPIHRIREIDERLVHIAMALAPAYLAIEVLATDDHNGIDVTLIESHPKFGPLWSESQKLKQEHLKLTLDIAIAWEMAHPSARTAESPQRHPSW